MKKLVIGIDLGTTYSCASVLSEAGTIDISPNSEGDRTTPSVMLMDSKDKITIGKDALVGAGSVITKDVDDNALGITRSPQKQIKDGAGLHRKKAHKKHLEK